MCYCEESYLIAATKNITHSEPKTKLFVDGTTEELFICCHTIIEWATFATQISNYHDAPHVLLQNMRS